MRHIYYLIIDSPERSNSVAHDLGQRADTLLATSEGTLAVEVGVIVPNNGPGLRPRVILEEVRRGKASTG